MHNINYAILPRFEPCSNCAHPQRPCDLDGRGECGGCARERERQRKLDDDTQAWHEHARRTEGDQ